MIIITGANGFIGSALARDLNSRGYENIIAVDTILPSERAGPLSHAKYQIFVSADGLVDWLTKKGEKVDVIFHMGACSSTTEKNWDYLYKNNTLYSQDLFRYCAYHGIPFIYASSAAVYGDGKRGFDDATKTDNFTPLNLYGKSKWLFDIWAQEQKEIPPCWAGFRFFNVYGPNEYHKGDMASVVYKAFHQIRENNSVRLFRSHRKEYAHGAQLRDFIYVKDVTNWMISFWKTSAAVSGIYNMGYGKARTWLDLANATFAAMNREPKIDWIDMPHDIREQYQYRTEATIERLLNLGLPSPSFSLEDGIRDYVRNYLEKSDPYL